jgi:hypothetical protein
LKDPDVPPISKKVAEGHFSKLNKAQQQPRKTKVCSVDDLNSWAGLVVQNKSFSV